MADPYEAELVTGSSFATASRAISASASDLDPIPKALFLAVGGDVTFVPVDNGDSDTVVCTGLSAGTVIPFRVRRVTAISGASVYAMDG